MEKWYGSLHIRYIVTKYIYVITVYKLGVRKCLTHFSSWTVLVKPKPNLVILNHIFYFFT